MSEEKTTVEKVTGPVKNAAGAVGNVIHKAADATIFDKSPHGTNIDGSPALDGALAKDAIDHTVLDMSPHGTNVDGGLNTKLTKH